jgi:hypothetical protein
MTPGERVVGADRLPAPTYAISRKNPGAIIKPKAPAFQRVIEQPFHPLGASD